jgi:hypothetical protein
MAKEIKPERLTRTSSEEEYNVIKDHIIYCNIHYKVKCKRPLDTPQNTRHKLGFSFGKSNGVL